MDEKLWKEKYGGFPRFPCPRCTNGKLTWKRADHLNHMPQYVAENLVEDGVDEEVESGEFVCLLRCNVTRCGQAVTVSGGYVTRFFTNVDGDTGQEITWDDTTYRIRSMYPPPPMIAIPKGLTPFAAKHIKRAYSLFWVDLGSCSNALRAAVEALLDQFGIDRDYKDKNGEDRTYSLSVRIDKFGDLKPDHKDALHALRYVGNHGSHEGEGDFQTVLDCFDVLEDALIEIFEERRAKRAAKIQKIIASKGNPKKK